MKRKFLPLKSLLEQANRPGENPFPVDSQAWTRPRRSWWIGAALTGLWLLWMTLRPDHTPNQINLVPLAEHGRAVACLLDPGCLAPRRAFWFLLIDVVGNTVVFMPTGFCLAGAFHRGYAWQTIRRAAVGGLALSLAIELSQLLIPSRATDVDDLIFNSSGALLGACLFFALYYQTKRFLENNRAA